MITQHAYPGHPQVRRNVQYLRSQEIQVDLVCMASSDLPEWGPRTQPGLHIYGIGLNHRRSPAFWYLLEYLIFFIRALPIVCGLSLRHRYTVVQVDNLPDALAFVAFLPRWRGARLVLNMFEHMPELTAARLRLGTAHPLIRFTRWVERMSHAWADHLLSVSEHGRAIVIGHGVSADKVSVIPNSLPPSPGPAWSPTTPPVLLALSTLVERYGIQIVIRALSELRPSWPELSLCVFGEGEQKAELTQLVADLGIGRQVKFVSFLPWDEAMAAVRTATIGIVALIPDGYSDLMLPTKLLDYVQHGLPVVCSRLPAIENHFPPDTLAYFAPGDAGGMAAQIDRLLRHPDEARRQALRALEAVRPLSWEIVAPRYLGALGLGPDVSVRQTPHRIGSSAWVASSK
jgi:glycosyltransferase involved in cell wall biosynthesis